MKGLRASIRLNQWDNDILKPYKSVKDELTVTSENIILRGRQKISFSEEQELSFRSPYSRKLLILHMRVTRDWLKLKHF